MNRYIANLKSFLAEQSPNFGYTDAKSLGFSTICWFPILNASMTLPPKRKPDLFFDGSGFLNNCKAQRNSTKRGCFLRKALL